MSRARRPYEVDHPFRCNIQGKRSRTFLQYLCSMGRLPKIKKKSKIQIESQKWKNVLQKMNGIKFKTANKQTCQIWEEIRALYLNLKRFSPNSGAVRKRAPGYYNGDLFFFSKKYVRLSVPGVLYIFCFIFKFKHKAIRSIQYLFTFYPRCWFHRMFSAIFNHFVSFHRAHWPLKDIGLRFQLFLLT